MAIHAGASDYLVKPFDREKLVAMLSLHVDKEKATALGGWYPQFSARPTPKRRWGKEL